MGLFNSDKRNKGKGKPKEERKKISILNTDVAETVSKKGTHATAKKDVAVVVPETGETAFGLGKDVDVTQFVDYKGDKADKKTEAIPEKNEKKDTLKSYFFKPTIDKKLTIIFIENTEDVLKEKETILKIVKGLVKSGYIYIINYGVLVKESEMIDVADFDYGKILFDEEAKNDACLYDALLVLESVVFERHNRTIENEKNKIKITDTEVIGIGRCIDNCSAAPKETALTYFYDVASKEKVTTKYFCLTEDSFIDAATVGFRSIGSIYRKFN